MTDLSSWLLALPDLRAKNVLLIGRWPGNMLPHRSAGIIFYALQTEETGHSAGGAARPEHVDSVTEQQLLGLAATEPIAAVFFWHTSRHLPETPSAQLLTALSQQAGGQPLSVHITRGPGLKSWFTRRNRAPVNNQQTPGTDKLAAKRLLPLRFNQDSIGELITTKDYRSIKNPGSIAERLRELLWSFRPTRVTLPGLLLTGGTAPLPPPVYEQLERNIATAIESTGVDSPKLQLKKFFVLPGKAILLHSLSDQTRGGTVTIVCANDKVHRHRSHEQATLNHIHQHLGSISSRVPKPLQEASCLGYRYFTQTEIAGITLDQNSRRLRACTSQAVDFLIQMANATHREDLINTAPGDSYSSTILRQSFAQLGDSNELRPIPLNKIHAALGAALATAQPAQVLQHGDYKIENVIFDRHSFRLQGVIDWDHSVLQGLPCFDLFYLLTYNRLITKGQPFYEFYPDLLNNHLTEWEQGLINRYISQTGVNNNSLGCLCALFFMDYITARTPYSGADAITRNGIRQALVATADYLTPPMQPAGP